MMEQQHVSFNVFSLSCPVQVICMSALTVIIKTIRIVIILKEKVEEMRDRRRSDKKGREESRPGLWG